MCIPKTNGVCMLSRIKTLTRNLLPYIFTRRNTAPLMLGCVFMGVNTAVNILIPQIFSQTNNSLSTNENMDALGVDLTPLQASICLGVMWTFNQLIANARNSAFASIGPNATKELVIRYINHAVDQSLDQHRETKFGDHNTLIGNYFMSVPAVTTQLVTVVAPTLLEFSIASIILARSYGLEISFGFGGMILIHGIHNGLRTSAIAEMNEKSFKSNMSAYEVNSEILTNYVSVHSGDVSVTRKRLRKVMNELTDTDCKTAMMYNKISAVQALITGSGLSLLGFLTARQVLASQLPIATFVTVSSYGMQVASQFSAFANAVSQLLIAEEKLKKGFEQLNVPSKTPDLNPTRLLHLTSDNASVKFENVKFSRNGTTILDGISFEALPGQFIGVVGLSGSGKTTIGHLIYRFLDPDSGRILIAGENTKDVGLQSLRDNIGYVSQDTDLFNMSIRANIEYGRPATLFSDEFQRKKDVNEAVKMAALSKFVESLPEGLETSVQERGSRLSGGQRQRVVIARTHMKKARILILDEAMSALDAQAKKEIKDSLSTLRKGRTTICITHNFSELLEADNIVVIDQGRIIEQGKHEVLIKREEGLYAKLWQEQQNPIPENKAEAKEKDSLPLSPPDIKAAISIKVESVSVSTLNMFTEAKARALASVETEVIPDDQPVAHVSSRCGIL
jgi:ABC-type multidrug transport system fused ATPase/permease subunit